MLLPRALLLLKLLEFRGVLRRFARQLKRPTGILFVCLYALIFTPSILQGVLGRRFGTGLPAEVMLPAASVFIGFAIVMTLLAPESRFSLNFKPAEIDILFTGPYLRRHVLTYKLLGQTAGALFMAAIAAVSSLAFARSMGAVFVGSFVTVVFLAQFSTAYALLLQAVSGRVKYLGYLVSLSIMAGCAYAAYSVFRDVATVLNPNSDPLALYQRVLDHPIMRAFALPIIPFAHTIAFDSSFVDWLSWLAVCVGVNAGMYALIILLDADFMESAIARSGRLYAQIELMKRGQIMSARAIRGSRHWSLPRLPRFGAFGPVAWRQLTAATQMWGRSVAGLYVIAVVAGMLVRRHPIEESIREFSLPALIGMLVYISLIAVNLIRFDFRTDLDVMDGLKTLPCSSLSIAAGQLFAPACVLSGVYVAFALGTAIAMSRPDIFAIVFVLAGPFSFLLIGVENVFFLLWPTRLAHQGAADIQAMGRGFLVFILKAVVLGPTCGIAAGVALATGYISGSSTLAYMIGGGVLAIAAIATVPAVAAAFDRFDPSTDTPP